MSNRGKLAILVFAIMILVILVFRYISKDDQSQKNEFVNLTLTLKDDINSNTGKYIKDDYLFFYSNEYKAKFVIPSNVYFVSERNLLENISKNDVLKVFIGKNVLPLLSNENKKVTVFGLTLNDKLIYSPDTYKIG